MCTHTRTLRMLCLGEKKTSRSQGKMKNKKIPVSFHYCRQLCPHHLQSYCQICPRKQGLGGEGKKSEGRIQQWHSRALNMRKLTLCGLLLWVSSLQNMGGKFVNGQKGREGGGSRLLQSIFLTVLGRSSRKCLVFLWNQFQNFSNCNGFTLIS